MLKMSPFITFLLYCLFVSFAVYYLTKDRLDEKSRYILIGVLVLPYIFMDQFVHFSNVNENENTIKISENKNINEQYSNKIEPPKIELAENEKVENIKIIEEIKRKEKISKEAKSKNKLYTLEEVQALLNKEKSKVVESFGSMHNGDPELKYNDDETFEDQSLKPLGENGNGFTNEWDHDYILLNTDKWAPSLKPPPVCKTEKKCPVCPNLTSGYPLMLRDFDSSRRITAPINANIKSMNETESST
jgi:hypothetical protein